MSSLVLFNTIPSGNIEVLFDDQNQPWFKRADLGRYLGIVKVRDSLSNFPAQFTRPRNEIDGAGATGTLSKDQNLHDVFVSSEGALEITHRSRKPKAVELIKWLAKKGVEKVLDDNKKAIEEKDVSIALLNDDLTEAHEHGRQLEHDNIGLQGEIRAKDQEILRRQGEIWDLLDNRYVPRKNSIDNILCFIDKQHDDEQYPYYVIRCQQKSLREHQKCLRLRYPGMQIIGECDDPNAVHRWCRFRDKTIQKPHFWKNHFSLDTQEKRELFEITFDVEI